MKRTARFYQLLASGESVLLNEKVSVPSRFIFLTYKEAKEYEPKFIDICTFMRCTGDFQCLKKEGLSVEIGEIVLFNVGTNRESNSTKPATDTEPTSGKRGRKPRAA